VYTACPNKKGATRFSHSNFYKCARIFMIFGVQLCKWMLLILVNLLRYVSRTSLTSWRNVVVIEITSWTWCCQLLQRETAEFVPQSCGHPIHWIWIRWTTLSGVSFKRF